MTSKSLFCTKNIAQKEIYYTAYKTQDRLLKAAQPEFRIQCNKEKNKNLYSALTQVKADQITKILLMAYNLQPNLTM